MQYDEETNLDAHLAANHASQTKQSGSHQNQAAGLRGGSLETEPYILGIGESRPRRPSRDRRSLPLKNTVKSFGVPPSL